MDRSESWSRPAATGRETRQPEEGISWKFPGVTLPVTVGRRSVVRVSLESENGDRKEVYAGKPVRETYDLKKGENRT